MKVPRSTIYSAGSIGRTEPRDLHIARMKLARAGRSRLLQRHWLGLYGVTIVAVFVVIAGIAHRSIVKPGALPASFGRDGKCYYVR